MSKYLKELIEQLHEVCKFTESERLRLVRFKSSLSRSLNFDVPVGNFSFSSVSRSTKEIRKEICFDAESNKYNFFFQWRGTQQQLAIPYIIDLIEAGVERQGNNLQENSEFNEAEIKANIRQIAIHLVNTAEEAIFKEKTKHFPKKELKPRENPQFSRIFRNFFEEKVDEVQLQKSMGPQFQKIKLDLAASVARLSESKTLTTEQMLPKPDQDEEDSEDSQELNFNLVDDL